MCFKKPKPDPKIAQEQERQDKLAQEAKAEEAAKAKIEQAKQLEREKAEQEIVRAEEAATRQKAAETVVETPKILAEKTAEPTAEPESPEAKAEAIKSAATLKQQKVAKMGATNTLGRASRRSGSRSRRSLITGLGGGIGYFDRFAQ